MLTETLALLKKKENTNIQKDIAVLGMGHVGLPTALGLAEMGWRVTGADSDVAKIELLRNGKSPFFEPGLSELLVKHRSNVNLLFTDDVETAIRTSNVLFICVGTPQAPNGEPDLTEIEALACTIARNLNGYKLIVEKSTVPALTGQWFTRTVERYASIWSGHGNGNGSGPQGRLGRAAFDVASNPEFLQEGRALEKCFHPDRVVCGVSSERARRILAELYEPLGCPILFTDLNTAELIKYAANAFLATKISFINMVADICESVGGDVVQVAAGIGLDSRIGHSFLSAGLGFGGYCLPKDLKAFIHLAEDHHVDASLLWNVEKINQRRTEQLVRKVRQALWMLKGKTIAVLGLSFKPETDDIRESPSLRVVDALLKQGARLKLYDPQAMPNAQQIYPEQAEVLKYCSSPYEAAEDAHAALLLTEWNEFRQLDLQKLRHQMKIPIIVDGRNILEPESVRQQGFEYICIGRAATVNPPSRRSLKLLPRRSAPATRQAAVTPIFAETNAPISMMDEAPMAVRVIGKSKR